MNALPCILVLVENERNEALLLKRSADEVWYPSMWSFVSGSIEAGEDPDAAMERELHEELMFKSPVIADRKPPEIYNKDEKQFLAYLYRVKVHSSTAIHLNEEHSEYRWVAIGDLFRYDVMFTVDIVLRAFKNDIQIDANVI